MVKGECMPGLSEKWPGDQWAGAEEVRKRIKGERKWVERKQVGYCRQRFAGG